MCLLYLNVSLCIVFNLVLVISCTSDAISSTDDDSCELNLRAAMISGQEKIFLFKTDVDQHLQLNKKLIYWATKLGYQIKTLNMTTFPECAQNDDITTTRLAAKYRSVINLRAKLITPTDWTVFDKKLEDVTIIGQSQVGDKQKVKATVCKSTGKYRIINDEKYETCEFTTTVMYQQPVYLKVISKSIEKHRILVKIIKIIDDNDEYYHKLWKKYYEVSRRTLIFPKDKLKPLNEEYILVCGIHQKPYVNKIRSLYQKILFIKSCNDLNELSQVGIEVLAVVAAKPLENEEPTDLPIIFYDSPNISLEQSLTYPNSMVLFKNYFKLLVSGLVNLSTFAIWKRIAIISDQTAHSEEFQRFIEEALTKTNTLYAVKRCLKTHISFEEALKYFGQNKAQIIIANVDARNVKKLTEAAEKVQLTASSGIMWIFRDLPIFISGDMGNLENTYTITLTQESKAMSLNRIDAAVTVVTGTINKFPKEIEKFFHNSSSEIRKNRLHRKLANMYRTMLQNYNTIFQLEKISQNRRHVAYAYNFKTNRREVYDHGYLKFAAKSCFFWSHNFEYPCDDLVILWISLVLFGFLLTVLVIAEFFRRLSSNHIRYRNLS